MYVYIQQTIACSASGKAGGFLGEAWGDGSSTEELHRKGFALHRQLAEGMVAVMVPLSLLLVFDPVFLRSIHQ